MVAQQLVERGRTEHLRFLRRPRWTIARVTLVTAAAVASVGLLTAWAGGTGAALLASALLFGGAAAWTMALMVDLSPARSWWAGARADRDITVVRDRRPH